MSFQQLAIELEKLFHSGQTVQAIQRCLDVASLVPDDAEAANAINAVEAYRKVLRASLADPLSSQIASAAIRHLYPGSPQDYASLAFQSLAAIKTRVSTAKLAQMLESSGLTVKSKPKPPPPESRVSGNAPISGVLFQRPKARAIDWQFWLNMRTVKLWQACALAVELDPDQLTPHPQAAGAGSGPTFAEHSFPNREAQARFDKALRLAESAVNWTGGPIYPQGAAVPGHLRNREVLLPQVAAFLAQAQFPLPPEMRASAAVSSDGAETQPAVAARRVNDVPSREPRDSSDKEGWKLKTSIERAPGYRWPLYQVLKAAHIAGEPCPKARDVLNTWALNPPPDVQVMVDGLKYNDGVGNPKEANLKAIQQAIKGLME